MSRPIATYDLRNMVMELEKSGSEEDRRNALALRMLYGLGCFEEEGDDEG